MMHGPMNVKTLVYVHIQLELCSSLMCKPYDRTIPVYLGLTASETGYL